MVSQKVGRLPLRNFLEMRILCSFPRPKRSEALGVRLRNLCLTSPEGYSEAYYSSKTTGLKIREIFITESRNSKSKEKPDMVDYI